MKTRGVDALDIDAELGMTRIVVTDPDARAARDRDAVLALVRLAHRTEDPQAWLAEVLGPAGLTGVAADLVAEIRAERAGLPYVGRAAPAAKRTRVPGIEPGGTYADRQERKARKPTRAARAEAGVGEIEHGTRYGYQLGCDCAECREANRVYLAEWTVRHRPDLSREEGTTS